MESIERDYVLVNPHYGSTETFSYHLETSVQDSTGFSSCQAKKNEQESEGVMPKKQFTGLHVHGLDLPSTSSEATISRELQGLSIQHPSTRLHLLHQYVHALTELAHEKVSFLKLSSHITTRSLWFVLTESNDGEHNATHTILCPFFCFMDREVGIFNIKGCNYHSKQCA